MKAFTRDIYGGPEVLQLKEIEKPEVVDGHIVVKVSANSVNPADWHILRGKPFFARFSFGLWKPKNKVPGADFAGIVTDTGKNVRRFKIGDRVFGESLNGGAFAEYICVSEDVCALMPDESKFTEMASLPIAGITALQGIIKHGRLQPGETVLINGASGGVGHFAVQIAKAYGGVVTAVCSNRNVEFVKSLGADKVIAYDVTDIHIHENKYDLVIDVNGNLTFNDFTRMGRRGVMIGFTNMSHMISVLLPKAFSKFNLVQFTADANYHDLDRLATLFEEVKINPRIDRIFSFKEIPEAIRLIESMRARGKVVVDWDI
jgi:NADPH:quinone reductase-like Zn-dependent oxidoreductase